MRDRVQVLHGVNLDMLGRRPVEQYGNFTLAELEYQIEEFAHEFELEVSFFQTNSEADYVEELHRSAELADGLILNPGAWTHYSWAIREALEIAGLPAVEVHISDLSEREDWRQTSVVRELCIASIEGRRQDGYRDALTILRERFDESADATS